MNVILVLDFEEWKILAKERWGFNGGAGSTVEPSDRVHHVNRIINMGVLRTHILRNSEKTSLAEVSSGNLEKSAGARQE